MDNRLTILERACAALSKLVRQEYPDEYSLAYIADIWGDATPEQVEALRLLENEPPVSMRLVYGEPTMSIAVDVQQQI